MSAGVKLDHAVVLVRSLAESLPWYEVLLGGCGFEKMRDHVFAGPGGFAIDIKQAKATAPDYDRYAPGLNHLGLAADRETHEAVRSAMRAARFDVPEPQHFDGEVATFFKDPDGLRIEIITYDAEA
ncbi:glyoxalase [Pacificimonas flava]|uniref:Glyoxalase n=2 Tax=Pacificimonas TaxID=1960290 RepID=A0A219B102_9SPHN|nr:MULTISPECIES: VOC family protein [Pacificimonas]MBZ6379727.1 VOC family protein [Pacificimonas aurantium]OWV31816.1 glyoxalase [Pacificimonas flava]